MSLLVIDASVAAGWCFEDEASAAGDKILREVAQHGAVVPALFHLEIGNVLRNAERRGRITEELSQRRLLLLADLPIVVDGETAAHAWNATLTLARQHTLTAYDAAYLELAIRRRATLASKDRDLLMAAGRDGVATRAC